MHGFQKADLGCHKSERLLPVLQRVDFLNIAILRIRKEPKCRYLRRQIRSYQPDLCPRDERHLLRDMHVKFVIVHITVIAAYVHVHHLRRK